MSTATTTNPVSESNAQAVANATAAPAGPKTVDLIPNLFRRVTSEKGHTRFEVYDRSDKSWFPICGKTETGTPIDFVFSGKIIPTAAKSKYDASTRTTTVADADKAKKAIRSSLVESVLMVVTVGMGHLRVEGQKGSDPIDALLALADLTTRKTGRAG